VLMNQNHDVPIRANHDVPMNQNHDVPIRANPDASIHQNPDASIHQNHDAPMNQNHDAPMNRNPDAPNRANAAAPIPQNPDVPIPGHPVPPPGTHDKKQPGPPPKTHPTPPPKPPPPCHPVRNVSFIKIHRCGSGTFHNVLVNFALNHKSTVALGNCLYYEMFPYELKRELLFPPPVPFHGYNMFIDHASFNPKATAAVLPKDTEYIMQIRHPFAHGFSAYGFMAFRYNKTRLPYDVLLTDPERYARRVRFGGVCAAGEATQTMDPSRNMMALELGYLEQADRNLTRFREFLQLRDSQLRHVSLLERLGESLVLLRRKMCWQARDILHLRLHTSGMGAHQKITLLTQHQQWSILDHALYDFFLQRHEREISEQTPDFQDEVTEHNIIQRNFTEFCSTICERLSVVTPDTHNIPRIKDILNTSLIFPRSRFHGSFSVTYVDCTMHMLDELITKQALIYQMYSEGSCGGGGGPKLPTLNCDVENHAIPGIRLADMSFLFHPGTCNRLKKLLQ
jgi:hypothetical protein